MFRKVVGLKWVRLAENPWPKTRLKGAALLGKRYEAKVARELSYGLQGLWFRFEDANGIGYASPDLLCWTASGPMIVEVKLTATEEAWDQLRFLYGPLVERWLGVSPQLCVVCKNLRPGWTAEDRLRHGAVVQWVSGPLNPKPSPWPYELLAAKPEAA